MELGTGHVFQFKIDIADTKLDSVATTFCTDHAEEIGVGPEIIASGCVEPVLRFLTEQVNTHHATSAQTAKPSIISVRRKTEINCIEMSMT